MLVPPLAGRAVKHLVDVPLDGHQLVRFPLALLVLGVPGILFRQQRINLRRQLFDGGQLGDAIGLEEMNSGLGEEQVGLMLLPVGGAGLGRFLCGEALPDGLGVPVDDDLPPQLLFFFQGQFDGLQLGGAFKHSGIGGGHSGVQFLRRGKAILCVDVEGVCHLFQIEHRCPTFVADALALSFFSLNVHHSLNTLGLAKLLPDAGLGSQAGTGGVALQSGTDGGAVEVIPQLPGGNGLGPVGGEVGQPAPALLDGDAPLQQPLGKILEADGHREDGPDLPAQLLLVRFKLGGRLTLGGVLGVQSKLPFLLRPILPFGDTVLAPAQQVNLVQSRPLAQLHDLGPEVVHGGGGAAVLGPGLGVAGPVHVGLALHLGNPQGVDDDVNMDVAAVVVAVRVGTDQGLVSGKLFGAEPLPQRLGLVHRQAVVGAVPGVKAEDVVVAFHVLPPLVFPIAEIGPHTGHGEVLPAAIQRRNAVVLAGNKPPLLVQDGPAGELVMLEGEVLLRRAVVGIFRA